MVRAKVDMKTAQKRLGHSDPRLTLALYVRATDEGDEEAAELLADPFSRAERQRPRDEGAMNCPCAREGRRYTPLTRGFVVGKAGFEPAASASRTLRANQAALLPVVF